MFRGYNLRQRIVIDVGTAERIGYITDVEINEATGEVERLVVRRRAGIFSSFFGFGEISVPWRAITAVGREYVLVTSSDFLNK